ncbi:hypothetical protein [Listeria rocourtiae]|uniref:hypothetical protein n=1 Tax=Listeria rocourtiae TaxID=647910 RepID=UPI0003E8BF77|nr:hypothetical protein [Listeria rocourtiae]EUJ46698.1 hypothetical protein PROCOU_11303 [Listeria rocourtiae FSL F6-920]
MFSQKNALEAAEKLYGDDIKEADFTIIQPYANGQGMILRVGDDENGERATKLDTIDTLTILPTIDATLDIYEEEAQDDDAE